MSEICDFGTGNAFDASLSDLYICKLLLSLQTQD